MTDFASAKALSLDQRPRWRRSGGGIDLDDPRYFSHADSRRVGGAVTGSDDIDFYSHRKRRPTHADRPPQR
jgi:hypothetical protein